MTSDQCLVFRSYLLISGLINLNINFDPLEGKKGCGVFIGLCRDWSTDMSFHANAEVEPILMKQRK